MNEGDFIPGDQVIVRYLQRTGRTGLYPAGKVFIPYPIFKEVEAEGVVFEFPVSSVGLGGWIGERMFGPQVSVKLEAGSVINVHSQWVKHADTNES